MKKHISRLSNALLLSAVFGAVAFGGLQSFANTASVEPVLSTCNAWACAEECGTLGGMLVPGGPGEPLKCVCCG